MGWKFKERVKIENHLGKLMGVVRRKGTKTISTKKDPSAVSSDKFVLVSAWVASTPEYGIYKISPIIHSAF